MMLIFKEKLKINQIIQVKYNKQLVKLSLKKILNRYNHVVYLSIYVYLSKNTFYECRASNIIIGMVRLQLSNMINLSQAIFSNNISSNLH